MCVSHVRIFLLISPLINSSLLSSRLFAYSATRIIGAATAQSRFRVNPIGLALAGSRFFRRRVSPRFVNQGRGQRRPPPSDQDRISDPSVALAAVRTSHAYLLPVFTRQLSHVSACSRDKNTKNIRIDVCGFGYSPSPLPRILLFFRTFVLLFLWKLNQQLNDIARS